MALTDKLTNIANEIRNKTSLTDEITLDQMVIDIASLPPLSIGDVPTYVQTEAERVADVVKALQNENTLTFIALSDVHVGSDTQSRNSALHASQAVNLIRKYAPIDFSIVLGDVVTGAASDSLEQHLNNLMQAKRTLAMTEHIAVLDGNHDANIYNSASYLSADEMYRYFGRHNIDVVKPSTDTDRNYFFFDVENKKTRVICLNTSDLKGKDASFGNDGHCISATQYQWFVSALDMTNKPDWKIIVLSHHPLHWYGYMPNVLTILNAYIAGSSGSFTADGTTISYNFSGKNSAKLVGTFHGHTHNFINGKVGSNEIIRMGTPNACYSRSNEYGSASYNEDFRNKYGETTTYSKSANSAKDTAFVVNVIDFDKQIINSICYGAGYDRFLSYSVTTQYSIKNVLSGVSTNNNAAVVEEGASYTAILTVADTYELRTITVTMGGVDITDTAYADGVITIAEVTGNIVITAKATAPVLNLVTNSLDLDLDGYYNNGLGYRNGYYISSSSLADSADSNCVATGLIEYSITETTAPTIYIKGITLDTTSHSRASFISETGEQSSGIYDGSFFNNGKYFTITQLAEQYYKLEPIMISDTDQRLTLAINGVGTAKLAQVKYIRFSFDNNVGDNLFIAYESIDGSSGDDSGDSGDSGETTAYTNQIPKSINADGTDFKGANGEDGYKVGYRLSTSSGNESSASGMSVTGFIPIHTNGETSCTIRIKDIDLTSSNSTYAFYDSTFAMVGSGYCNSTFGAEDENGVRSYTSTSADRRYIRISGAFGTNPIITVNEEII